MGASVVVLVVVALLVVAQLVLPGIAQRRLRSQLTGSGQVLGVSVSAFPAVKLLWHHADTVVIRMGRYRASPADLPDTLNQAADVGTLRASASEFVDGLLTLHNASLVKRGSQLTAGATVRESDLHSVLPILSSVTPVASSGGSLVLRGTALGISVDATVSAQDGALVVAPDLPFGGLATLTLFSDPRIAVTGIGAAPAQGGFALHGTALLH